MQYRTTSTDSKKETTLLPFTSNEGDFMSTYGTDGSAYDPEGFDEMEPDEIFEKITSENSIIVPEGTMSIGGTKRPEWLKAVMRNSTAKNILIYICFWLSSAGTFFGWFSMSASLFHWTPLYGKDILLYMTSAYSSPAFFVQLLQARFDFHFNMKYGKVKAFRIRMFVILITLIIIIVSVPFLPVSLPLFLSLTFLMGICSSAAYGCLFQLVALYSKKTTSFLSLGYASPGLLLLLLTLAIFGKNHVDTQDRLHIYFGIVTGAIVIALFSFELLLWLSTSQLSDKKERRIRNESRRRTTTLSKPINAPATPVRETPNNLALLKTIWKSAIGIALLMISRLTVFTILPHVPAEDPANQVAFSQMLVFINLGGDLFGRFLTVVTPRYPDHIASYILLGIALLHFSVINLVLLYVYSHIIPLNDIAVQVILGAFASTTGYLQTNFYAYATYGIPDVFKTQIGALMNVSTQVGNFTGLAFSFVLRTMPYR
eukprot:TRINITY_DN8740_c0_g1_i1.p1 TRINITY_DN8740_c0_g1~~TRINITY_DN8740_c0_g1_i1.p1  ORF type:complete len:486 (-),score=58.25 TRINITY_DN8740_c0_g1_i1:50-1507(-)